MLKFVQLMNRFLFFLVPFLFLFSLSCSLNYTEGENSEGRIPEFTFKNAVYTKYKEGKKNLSLRAAMLEQYKSDGAVFAKDASFESYDNRGEVKTNGKCSLVSADTKKEIYTLYDNISINLIEQNMQINADSLSFNKKTEQLTSGFNSPVNIKKDGLSVSGSGFSASAMSRSFIFSGGLSGNLNTKDEEKE